MGNFSKLVNCCKSKSILYICNKQTSKFGKKAENRGFYQKLNCDIIQRFSELQTIFSSWFSEDYKLKIVSDIRAELFEKLHIEEMEAIENRS